MKKFHGTIMESRLGMQNLPTDFYWYLVTIDMEYLTGRHLVDMLSLAKKINNYNYAVVDRIFAISQSGIMELLTNKPEKIFEIENLLELINKIDHPEWADFFLFKEYPRDWENPEDELYPYLIVQSDTTLRAVDDQYLYIYTQSKQLVDAIKSKYEIESEKMDLLENLDFPE